MKWFSFSNNWFSVALVLLVLAAMAHKCEHKPLSTNFIKNSTPFSQKTALGLASDPIKSSHSPVEIDQTTSQAFLKRFAKVAKSESNKFGMPASVYLAIAFLNSHAGQSEAAVQANNIFGLACSEDWEGQSVITNNHCLKQYESAWEGWRDFSIHLSNQPWFGNLKQSAGENWAKWAEKIPNKDISGVSELGNKIVEVIRFYRLDELDE